MQKTIKITSIIIFTISLLTIPFFGIAILFGIAGSTASYFIIIALGYVGLVISSFVCIFRYKFFPAIIISIVAIILGGTLDSKFWKNENSNTCQELRAEPSCIEDECGFTCSSFNGSGFTTGAGICKDKDINLCMKKVKAQNSVTTHDVLAVYSNIVDKIIGSPSPASENFENQLVAVYNCLELKYGSGTKGEQMAIQILKQKKLTDQQISKYYSYHASKGRNINPQAMVAGLPNGDKNLSCEYINVK